MRIKPNNFLIKHCYHGRNTLGRKKIMSERKCPNCGRVIPMDAIYCPYCGKKF